LTGWTGSRVDPPGRPGFTGLTPKRVFTSTRTSPKPGSRVDAPGRSGFQNTGSGTYNYPSDQNYHYMFPLQLTILVLSKTFPMSYRHIFKINITHFRIISHKLIHISVNSHNNPSNINFFFPLRPNFNLTMIINTLLLQPISKFIAYSIHLLIYNV
jgi:hypothetical protein